VPKSLIAYNRNHVFELLREGTGDGLWQALACGAFGMRLSQGERQELALLFEAWHSRALGQVMLRDAVLVDPQRGQRLYSLLCAAHVVALIHLPGVMVSPSGEIAPEAVRQFGGAATALALRAEAEGLQLCVVDEPLNIPLPIAQIESLVPPWPRAPREPELRFEQPGGVRRWAAIILATAGALSLIVPLLMGDIPAQAAGLPLALLTLALLIGIQARWPGYLGSLLIWSVANLPGFHRDTVHLLWPAIPLLSVGLILLALDQQIRAMWRWISRKGLGIRD
jgi:hypothetical protein